MRIRKHTRLSKSIGRSSRSILFPKFTLPFPVFNERKYVTVSNTETSLFYFFKNSPFSFIFFLLSSLPPSFFPFSHSAFYSYHLYSDVLFCLLTIFCPKVVANFHLQTVYVSLAHDPKLLWTSLSISFRARLPTTAVITLQLDPGP